MPVEPFSAQTLSRAGAILRSGGVVAFPTETVYGLGANALDPRAVAKIFEIKQRPSFDPLIVHVNGDAMLRSVTGNVSALARRLMERFWPGPLTLVLPKSSAVPDLVTSGLPTVGIRMPSHPVARALLDAAQVPIAAPSANPFGFLSPTRAEHVERMLGDRVDLIVDGGATEFGIESTIVLLSPQPTLLRSGAVSIEDIEAITGPLATELTDETAPLAPGRLPHHYAPRAPVRIVDVECVAQSDRANAGLLAFQSDAGGYAASRILSPSGDLNEAAAHLFEALHELDSLTLARIDAEPVPERGIGIAIMDRLRRAAR